MFSCYNPFPSHPLNGLEQVDKYAGYDHLSISIVHLLSRRKDAVPPQDSMLSMICVVMLFISSSAVL